uniref:Uncharacterized protein n=1 Tax=Anguilla anguilla TaxID=7936 RepID=A0A0E9P9T7_ANGAN
MTTSHDGFQLDSYTQVCNASVAALPRVQQAKPVKH